VAVGAIFPTRSKDVTREANIERIREVRAAVDVPVVAIGGINVSNVTQVLEAGADAAAVISAVCGAEDPRLAASELAKAFPTSGARKAPGAPDVRALVERYVARFNAGARDAWVALFSNEATQHDPVGEPPRRGRAEVAAWWERAVAPYDEIQIEARRISVNGNEAALSWTIIERHEGKQRSFEGVDIITFDARGLIVEVRAYWDRASIGEFR
jgi:ketosteroid isomerase-like protein